MARGASNNAASATSDKPAPARSPATRRAMRRLMGSGSVIADSFIMEIVSIAMEGAVKAAVNTMRTRAQIASIVVFFTSSITAYVRVSRTPGNAQITEPTNSR